MTEREIDAKCLSCGKYLSMLHKAVCICKNPKLAKTKDKWRRTSYSIEEELYQRMLEASPRSWSDVIRRAIEESLEKRP